jgi:hypothetical protein
MAQFDFDDENLDSRVIKYAFNHYATRIKQMYQDLSTVGKIGVATTIVGIGLFLGTTMYDKTSNQPNKHLTEKLTLASAVLTFSGMIAANYKTITQRE